jgi:hypothetical protein
LFVPFLIVNVSLNFGCIFDYIRLFSSCWSCSTDSTTLFPSSSSSLT